MPMKMQHVATLLIDHIDVPEGRRSVGGSQLANLLGQSVFRGTSRCTLPMYG